jgi:hypothetical protein
MEQSPSWEANGHSVGQEIHFSPIMEPEGSLQWAKDPTNFKVQCNISY